MRNSYSRIVLVACLVFALCASARALDPALDMSQYAHTAWRVRDGFVKGLINAIAQTPDGYLWLGTQFGVYRFDGVRAVLWQPPAGQQFSNGQINFLLAARDGTLWIAAVKGLASWKDGKLEQYPDLAGQMVSQVVQDREGTIWVGAYNPGKLCAMRAGKAQCYGEGSFGVGVWSLYEDHKGSLWAASNTGLWRWKPGNPEHYLPGITVNCITETDAGELLLITNNGLKQFADGRIRNYALPGITGHFIPTVFSRSSDGSLWIGTQQGLLRLYQGRTETFDAADSLSGDSVTRIFEDAEGNLWVVTSGGLDRFREYAITTVSRRQGLSTDIVWSVQATTDGRIWMGGSNGLSRWANGDVTTYSRQTRPEKTARTIALHSRGGLASNPGGLGLDDQGRLYASTKDGVFRFEDSRFVRDPGVAATNIWSMFGDGHGKLWVEDGTAGLFHFAPGEEARPIPWSRFGQKGFGPIAMVPDRRDGGIWLGFVDGGVAYFKDGEVRVSYTPADGLGNGRVNDLRFGSRGTLWAATEGGLSRIRDGRVMTLTSRNGLPCDTVLWTAEDDEHFVWVFQPCGLARIARSELDAWVSDARHIVNATVFDASDGVRNVAAYGGFGPRVTKARDGKIWFVTYDGVSVIDPLHVPTNKLPPPVQIEQITADRKSYDVPSAMTVNGNGVRLPALVRDLEIDYTALSLVAPEKIRFRTKLEGWDRDWQDVDNRRQAFYTGLGPKRYRFRVMACNNSGVWNEAGTFLDFSIAPAYYQTNWFQALCVVAFLGLLWGLYWFRVHQIQMQFNAGLEATVRERTRIARELHDTLLQSFHGLMFQFQAARNMLPPRPENEKAAQAFDKAILTTEHALAESRDAIRDLRPAPAEQRDLAGLLRATGQELAAPGNVHSPDYRVIVEGEPQTLTSILQYEIYRIAREVIRNAFHHAVASRIEVEIRYDAQQLRLRIRDDGKGIEENVLQGKGPAGHWGISGMRERATKIGSRLEFWSEVGAGTEVELRVPAALAYEKGRDGHRFRFFRKAGSYERHV